MIGTGECKEQQLRNGYFQSGTGPTEVLIVGSCRTVPYLNYLVNGNDGSLTIRRIDPCDWTFNGYDLNSLETDERILNVLKSTNIFIHEHLVNYGMFNTAGVGKNIFQFGLDPETRISVPNFNDHMILEEDYRAYGAVTPDGYIEKGNAEILKFCGVCTMSSFPEFAQMFFDTWKSIRYFWRPNHISAAFTKAIFKLMNAKFLHLDIGDVTDEDLFQDPHTNVTQRDRDGYGITW